MHNSQGSLLGIAVLLLSSAIVTAAPKGILSVGPEDADTSFILDSRGGVETFQGALPNEDLLARHEILKEQFKTSATPGSEYQIAYEVHAPSTGDGKSFLENRYEDGTVTGQYSIMNPDGTHRIITYSSSPEAGFKATFGKKIVDEVDDLEPAITISEPEYNPDRLGFFDDSDEQRSSRNFNPEREGYESDTQDQSYYGGYKSGFSGPTVQQYFNYLNTIRYDGNFGAKQSPNTKIDGLQTQYLLQNSEKPQLSAHIKESTRKWPFKSQNEEREDYAAHIQDNSIQQLNQNKLKESDVPALFQPSFHLIPVSIQKFSFDDMLQKYNVEHEYKWLERRKVPFTVMPAFIRRFD